jgi:tripartite-type tricarboxylate transporter receptor subunit TctC
LINIVAVVKEPQISETLECWGLAPVAGTPEQFMEFLRKDVERYAKIVCEANIPKS